MVFPADNTPFALDVASGPGISLSVDAATVHESTVAASCFRRQVFELAAAGLPVSVSVACSTQRREQGGKVDFLFGLIADAMHNAGASTRDLIVVMDASSIRPRAGWDRRRRYLGAGPLYFRNVQHASSETVWRDAWELQSTKAVGLLDTPFVLSPCRLLPAESVAGVVPGANVQGPPGTAWVGVVVDVDDLADSHGDIDPGTLDAAVSNAVLAGERRHSGIRWPTARLRHDAWLNRRLAVELVGVGALARRRGLDPGHLATLDDLSRIVRRVRDCAIAESQRLAASVGHVPALEQADLANALPGGRLRDGWSERWRLAVEADAVRHRNLLVMSPWSLFPPGETDPAYLNLLPLLRYVDTCTALPTPELVGWKFNDFRNFHQQSAAVLHQRGVAHQIAVQA